MDKLKSVTVRLAAELSQYQLLEEDDHSDHKYQYSDNGYQQSDNGYQHSDHKYHLIEEGGANSGLNESGEQFGGCDEVEEDIIWDYYHFPKKEEEESEDDITGDEAEQWLLRDTNHTQERYGIP